MNTFLGSLKVMGLGMLGIFIVTIVLIVIMMLLTKIFPARANGADSIEAANTKEGKACSQTNDTDR
ncbi:MAG: OadG family protein [Bilifractor sp.]|nr:OadG family protein [Bilifractor sp.]